METHFLNRMLPFLTPEGISLKNLNEGKRGGQSDPSPLLSTTLIRLT